MRIHTMQRWKKNYAGHWCIRIALCLSTQFWRLNQNICRSTFWCAARTHIFERITAQKCAIAVGRCSHNVSSAPSRWSRCLLRNASLFADKAYFRMRVITMAICWQSFLSCQTGRNLYYLALDAGSHCRCAVHAVWEMSNIEMICAMHQTSNVQHTKSDLVVTNWRWLKMLLCMRVHYNDGLSCAKVNIILGHVVVAEFRFFWAFFGSAVETVWLAGWLVGGCALRNRACSEVYNRVSGISHQQEWTTVWAVWSCHAILSNRNVPSSHHCQPHSQTNY